MNGVRAVMSLQSQLNQLAASFTQAVIEAIRAISLEELVAETGGLRGMPRVPAGADARGRGRAPRRAAGPSRRRSSSRRLKRRSHDDIEKALGEIVSLVGNQPRGMRAEQIRSELGMEAKEMPRILGEGLATRRLRKRGQKRATTYYAA
jgi:hypothetical protein